MSFDGIRGYVQFATGIGDATRARAAEVAQGLVSALSRTSPSEMAGQVSTLAEELLNVAKSNRESLIHLIRGEVGDLIESSSSLAKVADLDAVRSALTQLGTDLDGLRQQVGLQSPAALVSSGAAAVVTAASSVRPGGSRPASKSVAPVDGPARVKRVPSRPRGSAAAARNEAPVVAAAPEAPQAPVVRTVTPESTPAVPSPAKVRKLTAKKAAAPAPAKVAAPAKEAAPVKKAAAKKAATVAKAAPAKAAPAKVAAPAKKAAVKKAATVAKAAPAKAAPAKVAAPAKKTAAKKAAAPVPVVQAPDVAPVEAPASAAADAVAGE